MRLIDADALFHEMDLMCEGCNNYNQVKCRTCYIDDCISMVDDAPTIDAVPVKHGHWIGIEFDGYADGYPVYDVWECSVCGNEIYGEDTPDYCCDCGAKMDEEVQDEDD